MIGGMHVIVGCPVRARAWIMPTWFDHVEAAACFAGVSPQFAFAVDPTDETVPTLRLHLSGGDALLYLDETDHPYPEDGDTLRSWGTPRVQHMVAIRNSLLAHVRSVGPDVFISVDSDVLLAQQTLADLLESLQRFDAVGGGTWMDERDHRIQSCGWVEGMAGFVRKHVPGPAVIPMGVIMAVKAMSPAAYAIDYAYERNGEDVGWSLACASAGVRLGWDNRHPSKHVMRRHQLETIDVRCGF